MERMHVEVVSRPLPSARRRGWFGKLTLLVGLLLIGLGLWLQGQRGYVAAQLTLDHRRAFAERPGGRVWSSEPAIVSDWLEQHGTRLPPLPAHAGEAGLVGARFCALADRLVAHVLYESESASVSIFVVPGPLRAPNGWSAKLDGLHLKLVRSAGRSLLIVGESEADVHAAARAFATTLA